MMTAKLSPIGEQFSAQVCEEPRPEVNDERVALEMESEVRIMDASTGKTCTVVMPKKGMAPRRMSTLPLCRICFESDQQQQHTSLPSAVPLISRCCSLGPEAPHDPLIRPCLCSGTAAWVHLMCLRRWQACSGSAVCELCLSPFEIPNELRMLVASEDTDQSSTGRRQASTIRYLQKLGVMLVYTVLLLIPLSVMVAIMSFPLGEAWEGDETGLGTSWNMLGRVLLSLLVIGVYIPLLYCCIFKRSCLLSWMNSDQQSERRRRQVRTRSINPTLMPFTGRNHRYIWHRRLGEREVCYMDAALLM
ncbi:E3 ubiquitin-protein ligase MARCH11-like [Acanthaster planci]|uniref:E3 ubiquitin-protein ligase MARCH11-like n=1 Tax=Acanthaster planci TaxID=133434 RepID=A0A8B8A1X7_ACAPL|nr:E3 ubiquitin-protein ligase MARCH11-like [Acanthaster planci]